MDIQSSCRKYKFMYGTVEVAQHLRQEGDALFDKDDFIGALGCYDQIVRFLKGDEGSSMESLHWAEDEKICTVEVLLRASMCHLRRQPCAAFLALNCCEEALRLKPTNQQAVFWKARALAELGEFAESEREYERTCELLPEDIRARQELEQLRQLARVVRGSSCQRHVFDTLLDVSPEEACQGAEHDSELEALWPAKRLGYLLGHPPLVDALIASSKISATALEAFAELAEQAIWMGIDYRSLGLGWHHPSSRSEYRKGGHSSTTCEASRKRADASRRRLVSILSQLVSGPWTLDPEAALVNVFLEEIGATEPGSVAEDAVHATTFAAVKFALASELLLPLRALSEGVSSGLRTRSAEPIPSQAVRDALRALFVAVLSDPNGFSDWRYGNAVGLEQLRGLSTQQSVDWREPLRVKHGRKGESWTSEDTAGEHGFFWATKIGGPSHGFDYEAQCLLPLLCNARHKVVLLSIPLWPAHPVCRAHCRLLWTASDTGAEAEPRIWLEAVNVDFGFGKANEVDFQMYVRAILRHAMLKADKMGAALSIDEGLVDDLRAVAKEHDTGGVVQHIRERLLLRPSNGVLEASDYLSAKHDWVQTREEVVGPFGRALYIPAECTFAFRAPFLSIVAESLLRERDDD